MIIRLSETVKVETENILCVLDIDSVTVKKRGQEIFNIKEESIVYCDEEELPLSCIMTEEQGKTKLYFSSLSTSAVLRHIEDSHLERKPNKNAG